MDSGGGMRARMGAWERARERVDFILFPPTLKGRRHASISMRRGNTVERSPQLPGPDRRRSRERADATQRGRHCPARCHATPTPRVRRSMAGCLRARAHVALKQDTDTDRPPSHSARLRKHTTSLHPCFPFAPSKSASNPRNVQNAFPPPTPSPPRTLLACYPALITPSSYYLTPFPSPAPRFLQSSCHVTVLKSAPAHFERLYACPLRTPGLPFEPPDSPHFERPPRTPHPLRIRAHPP
ncbi:hypothetical protein K438DRAFT_915413 [Mycena galopus ATCC 62051]|nr:hypothetical protein K438DRAFT_915413 [Mycena galopus ATCC 62051]